MWLSTLPHQFPHCCLHLSKTGAPRPTPPRDRRTDPGVRSRAPQAPAALPATLAPRPARCSPGTPQTRNRRRYATPRFEARTRQLRRRSPWTAEAEGWCPGCPVLTARGARAAQPEPQQRPQRDGTQRGHLRGRRPRRSAWGAGPDQESRSRVRYPAPAARRVPELPLRRPCAPRSQAAARSLAESFWLRGAAGRLACPSA